MKSTLYSQSLLEHMFLTLYERSTLPHSTNVFTYLGPMKQALEQDHLRPLDDRGRPGGVVLLKALPTLIIPDLHARKDFMVNLFLQPGLFQERLQNEPNTHGFHETIMDQLHKGKVQVVFVGDAWHTELAAKDLWSQIETEYRSDFRYSKHTEKEMNNSLVTFEMVALLKSHFPDLIHFLKGNHENIDNETGNGNYSFSKYSLESEITATYFRKRYGQSFIKYVKTLEKSLPLLAAGHDFLVSHSEPLTYYPPKKVINYRKHPKVTIGLTWTKNDMAHPDAVAQMLNAYTEKKGQSKYFAGHRSVAEKYRLRSQGAFVQIHNPRRENVVFHPHPQKFDLERDIITLNTGFNHKNHKKVERAFS